MPGKGKHSILTPVTYARGRPPCSSRSLATFLAILTLSSIYSMQNNFQNSVPNPLRSSTRQYRPHVINLAQVAGWSSEDKTITEDAVGTPGKMGCMKLCN